VRLFCAAFCESVATMRKNMSPHVERRELFAEPGSRGIRLTAQRPALGEAIQETKEHLDAGSLVELARRREPNINRATVYRTIELLKKLRLIDELDLMHLEGEKHYHEVKTKRDHVHLASFRCGRIEEFSSPLFDALKPEISKQAVSRARSQDWTSAASCRACAAYMSTEKGDGDAQTVTALNQ
jgi:Fe2+ or Zn2+ uptake regulation protein